LQEDVLKFFSIPPPCPHDPLQEPEEEPSGVEAQVPESSHSSQGEDEVLVEDASSSDDDEQTLQQRFEVKGHYGYSRVPIPSGVSTRVLKRPASSLADDVMQPSWKKRTTVGGSVL
jgi:hypothetical protein